MSLVKEYPLQDITELEYAIGSAGGPLFSLVQLAFGLVWVTRAKDSSWVGRMGLGFVLANVSYLLVRSGIALLSGDGGELSDAASLVGLSYQSTIVIFALISLGALLLITRVGSPRLSVRSGFSMLGLLVLYFVFLVAVQSFDRAMFWERFPTIEIGEGRLYNEHRS
jgi:hypothetical protein